MRSLSRLASIAVAAAATYVPALAAQAPGRPAAYAYLVSLFEGWRRFEQPPFVEGAPDYRPATNARRLTELGEWQRRLATIDTAGWPIPQRVDWHLVRAEMAGMQYHLTVLQPFARDPAYYASIRTEESDTPAEEGPTIHGAIRLWRYPVWPRTVLDTVAPLSPAQSRALAGELRGIPPLLAQARANLAGSNARDLWVGGIRAFDEQVETLDELAKRVPVRDRELVHAITAARAATVSFKGWLEAEAPGKTGPSGIGKAQYTWFLKHVLLVPLTWDDEVQVTRRELARAHMSLRLEEQRNRVLPPLEPANTPEAYRALQDSSLRRYFGWLRSTDLVTVEPWMERALRERMHPFAPEGRRNFVFQTNHRDPLPLWTHLWHWWDNARIREQPHPSPIRRTPLLYNVWMSRAEGTATVMEEYMMHAGLYDQSPRSREIVWIMLMNRAARGLGNLYAHSNELTMQQAGDIHVNWTPRGWMRRDPLLGFEQHLYLRQPGYGPAYVTGGRLVDEIIAERARQLGPQFSMRRFYDEFTRAGMIPVSLIYWELTGDDRMVRELEDGVTLRPFR
ncbi:MAG: DUF885 family protein [Gemmatimonadota bacterium]